MTLILLIILLNVKIFYLNMKIKSILKDKPCKIYLYYITFNITIFNTQIFVKIFIILNELNNMHILNENKLFKNK